MQAKFNERIGPEFSLALLNVRETKRALERALVKMNQHIATLHDYPVWVYGCKNPEEARQNAVEVFGLLHYVDDMKPEETSKKFGVLGGDGQLLELARSVNECKERFEMAMSELRREINPGNTRKQRGVAMRRAVELLRDPRFHYRQAIRRLKILDESPKSMRFTWLRAHDIRRISREAALQKLVNVMGDSAKDNRDYRVLSALSTGEMLAEVTQTPHDVHLNIRDQKGQRKALQVNMPVIFLSEKGAALPDFLPLRPHSHMQDRKKRKDQKVEDEPLIPGLNLYRYREQYRV